VIGLAGTFHQADVGELTILARSLSSTREVVLDFHEVEVIDDGALAELATELRRQARGHVVLVGLSEHHHRLLQYLREETSPNAHHPEG
jgi:anti-anti-sigma regulatory factor